MRLDKAGRVGLNNGMQTIAGTGIFAPHPNPTLRVLSLGLGVQSTCLLFMAADGAFGPPPDIAFFADTQAEPKAIYQHLDRLRGLNSLPFPIRVVTAGNLRDDVVTSTNTTGARFAAVPFFTKGEHGELGKGRRQCTKEYKLEPLWAAIRSYLGVEPGRRVPKGVSVETWLGMTTDEVIRVKQSRHHWEHARWPLIEAGMSRGDCVEELIRRSQPVPPRSRCKFCPFTSNEEWRRIEAEDHAEWDEAIEIDRLIRDGGKLRGMRGQRFIHRSCVPLDEADLRAPDPRQGVMGELCEGVCGV